jgi:hypothetical protein
MRMCETIEGPDSEELLSELLRLYGDRPVIKFHRAVMNNDIASVTEQLGNHPEWLESTLMPVATYEEVAKCNDMDYDAFWSFLVWCHKHRTIQSFNSLFLVLPRIPMNSIRVGNVMNRNPTWILSSGHRFSEPVFQEILKWPLY